ncbi:HNH endonuclease [Lederbergia citrea]|uniref:HNH endonuclease n=1 Tax=Lederbergia citrea TaxID=2833581 RepID=A0A942UN77_9BACI|nr:HNH endonuclease signature motif containing protein [Lederbergia citrea]MBS4222407.1 HNH endonuclease [Lederbergia citrea]
MIITKKYLYRKYVVEGLSVKEIAEEVNLTKHSIRGKLRRFGIRKKPFKIGNEIYDNRDWLYHQYVELNKGYTVIAKELGVSYTTILSRILYFGWKVKGHKDIDKGAPRRGKKHKEVSLIKIRETRQRKRIITSCFHCQKSIELVLSIYKRSENSFCNRDCFISYLKENRVICEDITDSAAYKEWRLRVYKRDRYRCKMPGCGSQSRDIAAHHIYPKKKYPEKKYEISNGITLCRSCHEKTYGKEEQFIEMLVRIVQTMSD